jgi:ribosomal protein L11 methyltransferase
VRVSRERAEEARALMLDLFPEGFEEVEADGDVELAAYTRSGGEERLWQAFGPGRAAPVANDWTEAWKRFHRPICVGPLWVGPPWETPERGSTPVVIDPGRAFGTGAHPTTRLCLELLERLPRGSVLDVGCGSGVLAIAAAKLGFSPVSAFDADRASVAATDSNARANAVLLDRLERVDLRSGAIPVADVVAANLMRPLLLQVSERMQNGVQTMILSGLLDHEADEVAAAFSPLVERRRVSVKGWSALLLGA